MPGGKYYAVRAGRRPGIFRTWEECKVQVNGYSGAVFKSFSSLIEAEGFNNGEIRTFNGKVKAGNVKQRYTPYSGRGYTPYSGRGCRSYSGVDGSHGNSDIPVVYSDGCCYGNGQFGARGGVGVYWGENSTWNVSEKLCGKQTNQRAELIAACRAIEEAINQRYTSIELRTDSTYTIKCVTQWISKWEREGWKTTSGQSVLNKDDIMRLNDLCKQVQVKWTHVRGHQGVHGNEMADQLAKGGSQL